MKRSGNRSEKLKVAVRCPRPKMHSISKAKFNIFETSYPFYGDIAEGEPSVTAQAKMKYVKRLNSQRPPLVNALQLLHFCQYGTRIIRK